MRITKKRGQGEPDIKMLSASEAELLKSKEKKNGKHTTLLTRIRGKKKV
jgi:hypothetical protein